ncbi:MAG: STAS/SEC14 domain-containing protein [Planctomycetales bacterium]
MADEVDITVIGNYLHVSVTGKLTADFYKEFVPMIEEQIKNNGKVRILFEMHDFHGWTAGALWEDLKFDFKHAKDIERLAVVGESKWEQGMATFCKPFTSAKIQYFDVSKLADAQAWIEEK